MLEALGYDEFGNNPKLIAPADLEYLTTVGVSRASGDVVCAICGSDYYSHPRVQGALHTTRVCDGRLVHL